MYLGSKRLIRKDISAFGTQTSFFPYHPHVSMDFFRFPHYALQSLVSQHKALGEASRPASQSELPFPTALAPRGPGPGMGQPSGSALSLHVPSHSPFYRFVSLPQNYITLLPTWLSENHVCLDGSGFPTDSTAHHTPQWWSPGTVPLPRSSRTHLPLDRPSSLASTTCVP